MQGRYKSVMAVVTCCRSDMSTLGLAPQGHLCDGRIHLVLVRDTSRLNYLRFLASIPRTGAEARPLLKTVWPRLITELQIVHQFLKSPG